MSRTKTDLPGIYKAALEIAYDNGGINRDRTEDASQSELLVFLDGYDADDADLRAISDWLGSLDEEHLSCLCAGDDEEQATVLAQAPNELQEKIDGLLTDIFNEVC